MFKLYIRSMSAAKEVHRLMRTIGALTDGQASVGEVDWDGTTHNGIVIYIRPNAGIYQGGKFEFHIELDKNYPSGRPPVVRCFTDILHPNIDTCIDKGHPDTSNVCLNLFDEGTWNTSFGLESIVLGLMFLLDNPNFDSILSPVDMECLSTDDEDAWKENVRHYMRGEDVAGTYFDAQFFSNVDGRALLTDDGAASNDTPGCDVDAMNAMCVPEKETDSTDTSNCGAGSVKRGGILGIRKHLSNNSLSQTGETFVPTEHFDNDRPFKLVSVNSGFALAGGCQFGIEQCSQASDQTSKLSRQQTIVLEAEDVVS